ncbi:o-succinylbenzoate synthase [Domibacillus epiphyticus]|uniref:o-succinylbenzoate synthase n=1 Tax=Domibacillus epiphyticus TaxID=1714355 RepID=A0A1V2A9A3_9BACI|nr:o-succinylbenzoate synthase [Domibacillus epiphyticus]OMP67394.1 o-succinylbenzoate synthase [Domibacillus epiphyticus]
MHIKKLTMRLIEMPLKQHFYTHLETVSVRQSIIIEAEDEHGTVGWGEASAFSTPWYTEETVKTEWHIIKEVLFPLLRDKKINHPDNVHSLFSPVRGNRMAKAGVESAIWDLYAKQKNKPLHLLLGSKRTSISAGAVAAGNSAVDMISRIETLYEAGYERIKVKIEPKTDRKLLDEVRRAFPTIQLLADANSAYSMNDIDQLKSLDEFNLLMIEQPFHVEDLWEHSKLQKEIKTAVCLDESIRSVHDAKCALQMDACRFINVKFSRVGGLTEAVKIHNECLRNSVGLWAGGMIEFGISRAHNVALAALPGFTVPGDIVSSDHYWEEDIIDEGINVVKGRIQLSEKPGIGYEVKRNRLDKVTIDTYFV